MPDLINTEQVNKLVQKLLPYLMNMNLMKQRQTGYEKMYTGLEDQRQGNRMEVVFQEYINKVSQLEPVKQMQAMIFQGKERGQDTSQYETQLSKYLDDVGKAALSVASGQPADEETSKTIAGLNQSIMASLVGQQAATFRQGRQIEEVAKPGLELEEERLGVRKDELSLNWAKLSAETVKDQKSEWISLIKDTESFLEAEGVKREKMANIMALFSTGKELDPLSPEVRGQSFSWLTMIRQNLIKGKMPSPEDERFLRQVKNSFAVEEKGLASPITGITPAEEADITGRSERLVSGIAGKQQESVKQNMIELLTQLYMEEGGFDEKTAREMATKYYNAEIRQ